MPFFVSASRFSGAKEIGSIEFGSIGSVYMDNFVFAPMRLLVGLSSSVAGSGKGSSLSRTHGLLRNIVVGGVRKAGVIIPRGPTRFVMLRAMRRMRLLWRLLASVHVGMIG